jgi:hypothetical protein
MAIAFGGFAVVVRNAALERQFPGGVAAYVEQAPNSTYISDGTLSAVSFMVLDDAKAWTKKLLAFGFSDPLTTCSTDVAVVHQTARSLSNSEWLNVGLRTVIDGEGRPVEVPLAWLVQESAASFSPPPGWRPITVEMVTTQDLQENYDLVNVDQSNGSGVVIAYRHRLSGRMLYVGRPRVGADDLQSRCLALMNELRRLLPMPISKRREDALVLLLNDADSVAKASDSQAWQPLFVQGVAARLLGKWTLAEQSFRAVTALHPSRIDAWLEFTWALAKLGKADEAEASARRAIDVDERSAPAHGNLASVLLQRGRPEEALPVITRAIELDPADEKNQMILKQVQQATGHVGSPTDVDPPGDCGHKPWYRRWF